VIAVPPGVRILLAARPVDFRKGMDGLAALVQQALRADPFAGDVFIFRPKRADRVKILVYDGTGLCLYSVSGVRSPPCGSAEADDGEDVGPER
jgi:transposase